MIHGLVAKIRSDKICFHCLPLEKLVLGTQESQRHKINIQIALLSVFVDIKKSTITKMLKPLQDD